MSSPPPPPSSPRPADLQDQTHNQIMRQSGSRWDKTQLGYFNIPTPPMAGAHLHPLLADINIPPLRHDIDKQIGELSSSGLGKSTHQELMIPGEFKASGTMLGPFFATLATVKEVPEDQELLNKERPQRERKQVEHPDMVPSATATESQSESESESGQKSNEARQRRWSNKSYSVGSSEITDKSAHLRRIKPETPTQVMFYLFCQGIFEGSYLGTRAPNSGTLRQDEHRLEWNVAGKTFNIESPLVHCVSINDGSLLWKKFSAEKTWGSHDNLAYCSIETKALFHQWDDDDLQGTHSEAVEAQEASQMIGMMCERLRAAAVKKQDDIDPSELSEYDRTTFLISGAQRSMFLKIATFEPEYIKYFFPGCLKAPRKEQGATGDPASDLLSAQLQNLDLKDDGSGRPKLVISVSRELDLSRGKDLAVAAQLVLQMGSYLEENGPLLKNISAGAAN